MHRIALLLGTGLAALACQPSPPGAPPAAGPETAGAAGGEIAAEVNGVAISVAELDAWIKEDLFRRSAESPGKLFELRQRGLDALVEERIVESEARKRGVGSDELIDLEVAALGAVSDAEVQKFYDENKDQLGGASFDDVKERIRSFLASRREAEALEALRERAAVVVHLEPPRVSVAATGPSKGPQDARVTIVEFSDFQCPFCQRVMPTLEKILEKYPQDVRVVYRNLPLRSHSRARPAAEAALCADEQGKFWDYHDKLFANNRALGDPELLRYGQEVGLDAAKFEACVKERRYAQRVDEDLAEAQRAGASGTPAFFVNGVLISGAKPPEDFFRVIDAELARLEQASSGAGGAGAAPPAS
jgi:protein-disulfide isomerase